MFRSCILLGAVLMLLPNAGCHRRGPAERAGERIDEAVDDAADAVGDTIDDEARRSHRSRY